MNFPYHEPQIVLQHAMAGCTLLSSLSEYVDDGADPPVPLPGVSPVGSFAGFVVGSAGVTIDDIDFGDYAPMYITDGTEEFPEFQFAAGQVYFLFFKQITITAGSLLLINNYEEIP